MHINRIFAFFLCLTAVASAYCQSAPLSLDSCRSLALRNNKAMQIARERIKGAEYQKKQAFAAYLPGVDFSAMYMYNQKEISLLSGDQMLPTKTFNPATGQFDYNLVMKPDGTPLLTPDGTPVPSQVAMIPKEAMTFDIHNMFGGMVTLTQPLFMGGKIRALNKMAEYGEEIAGQMLDHAAKEVVYTVDAAYWQVVSLREKQKLADSYIELLDTLHRNVSALIVEGLATKGDLLNVEVKLNEANIDQTKVENGVALAKMALAQICGMPLNEDFSLVDEETEEKSFGTVVQKSYDMESVYAGRADLKSLEMAVKVFENKQDVARAGMMPTLALVGSYSFSNPNVFNGFDKSVKGMFSVGAMLKVPLWHWGGNYNKYRAARSEKIVKELELEEAREKVELQVTQASYKTKEAAKRLAMTRSNLSKAEENLRQVQIGYREGVMPLDNVMSAQTAWLKAHSEQIDAEIDLQLCSVYLSKVTGTLSY